MHSPWFGEFMGTLVLILLGDGVVAGVLLKRSKAESSGWLVITSGWAFAVMCGIFTAIACGSPQAHLNPAVTLGVAVSSGDFSHLLPFLLAQVGGAIVGATLVWIQRAGTWIFGILTLVIIVFLLGKTNWSAVLSAPPEGITQSATASLGPLAPGRTTSVISRSMCRAES